MTMTTTAAPVKPKGKKKREPTVKVERHCRVYSYGCQPPVEQAEMVHNHFRLAHRYRNKLCEVALQQRAAYHEILRTHSPALAEVRERLGNPPKVEETSEGKRKVEGQGLLGEQAEVDAQIRMARVALQARQRLPQDHPLVVRKEAIKAQVKDLRAQEKILVEEFRKDPTVQAALKTSNDAFHVERLRLRNVYAHPPEGGAGLNHGTYLAVEEACSDFMTDSPPEFRRWTDRKDKVGVQLQTNRKVSQIVNGQHTFVRLVIEEREPRKCGPCWMRTRKHPKDDPRPCVCHELPPPSSRRPPKATLWLRIASDENRGPVWAKFPIVYHRPLPPDVEVMRVFVTRRDLGSRSRWSAQFVLATQDSTGWNKPGAKEGTIGVDIGWRLLPEGGLRVAAWAGSDGATGQLVLPQWWLDEYRRVEGDGKGNGIVGYRRKQQDIIREVIATEFSRHEALPEQLLDDRNPEQSPAERAAQIRMIKSYDRLRKLVEAWKDCRLPDDDKAFKAAEAWRKRDLHLYDFEANLRDQLQASRKDLYRRFAARLHKCYKTVVYEQMDLRDFHELPAVEKGMTNQDDAKRKYARLACCSEVFGALQGRTGLVNYHGMTKGVPNKKPGVDPSGTTTTCHKCGYNDTEWKDHADLLHECVQCGEVWDQDFNAAWNILAASGTVLPQEREALAVGETLSYAPGPNKRRQETIARERALEK